MTKPMYCPFRSRAKTLLDWMVFDDSAECTPDCAWAVRSEYHDIYMCAIALRFYEQGAYGVNARPLGDDAE